MKDFVDGTAFNNEQGNRARKLFAAVVLAALDDAIADDKKYGNGPEQIARWARSRDGREVLSCAGIDPNERVVEGLMEFVTQKSDSELNYISDVTTNRILRNDHEYFVYNHCINLLGNQRPVTMQTSMLAGLKVYKNLVNNQNKFTIHDCLQRYFLLVSTI